jgi:hypothetical protein
MITLCASLPFRVAIPPAKSWADTSSKSYCGINACRMEFHPGCVNDSLLILQSEMTLFVFRSLLDMKSSVADIGCGPRKNLQVLPLTVAVMKQGVQQTFLRNLQAIDPSVTALRCPICLAAEPSTTLTNGHVYPTLVQAPGGVVPECSGCNGKLGAFSDADLVHTVRQFLLAHNQLPENEFRKLRMSNAVLDGRSARLTTPETPGVDIAFAVKGPAQRSIQLPDGRVYLSASFEGPTHANAIVGAVIHSAYLKLFRFFGYDYVHDPGGTHIQRLLHQCVMLEGDKAAQRKLFTPYFRHSRFYIDLPKQPNMPYVYRGDDGLCGFLCFVPAVSKKGLAVLMPGFGQQSLDAYLQAASTPVEIHGVAVPFARAEERETLLETTPDFGRVFYTKATHATYPAMPINLGKVDNQQNIKIDNGLL